jgi:hypothetical protein
MQKDKGIVVKHIRCDNAGDNVTLQDQIIHYPNI